MKRIEKKMIAAVCCAGLLAVGAAGVAMAQSPVILAGSGQTAGQQEGTEASSVSDGSGTGAMSADSSEAEAVTVDGSEMEAMFADSIRIWGTVLGVEDGMIRIDNQSGVSFAGEIVLNIDDEHSRVLDAENGFPVALEDIQAGEVIYAWIGPAMTMSLPPMTTAEMVICKIPADYKVPDYVTVKSMEEQQDGSWVLTAANESVYQIPADCDILPYLTRNMVRLTDVEAGSKCLIWSDANGVWQKIVLFSTWN